MTSASLSEGIDRTPPRGWAALMLYAMNLSILRLSSFTLGVFLPFIAAELGLTPLQAGLLQGVWWLTAAATVMPFGVWMSRFRPGPLTLASMLLSAPFLLMQGLAGSFIALFAARFFAVLFHALALSARPMIFQQWAAPRQYALINAVGLSQHSALLAAAVSGSALLISAIGWRSAYSIQAAMLLALAVAWLLVARQGKAPLPDIKASLGGQPSSPLAALRKYPQAWLIAIVMFALAAVWTGVITFLPTLLLEERGIAVALGGPILGFLYYGLAPGALAGGWVNRKLRDRRVLLAGPAALNSLLALGITLTANAYLLAALIAALGLVWVAVAAIEMLPFELDGIRPREVSAVNALIVMHAGLGFAAGPMIVGFVAEQAHSLQTGLIAMAAASAVGVAAGLMYPVSRPKSADAAN